MSRVADDCDLRLSVTERSPYTTSFDLTYLFAAESGITTYPDMRVRIYHDARLVEAQEWATQHDHEALRRLRGLAERELDQRWARNTMLNKWLEYCIDRGHGFRELIQNPAAQGSMKALKPFGLFGKNEAAAGDTPEDGRVVELFRSRAELRKQHDELGQELQRLRDRLKQQEAATSRVQEMFEALERRLEAADTGLSTLVFYHLRALWGDGREIIALLVKDLSARQEERERKAFALEGNRRQFQQRKDSEQQLRQAESQMVAARRELADLDAPTRRTRQVVASLATAQDRGAAPGAAVRRGSRRGRAACRACALRADRKGRRGRFPWFVGRVPARHQSRGHRLRRSVVPAPGAHQPGRRGAHRNVATRIRRELR